MIKIYGGTDRGRVRATNQDTYAYKVVDEETAFAIVCDGMGGEKGGHVASAKAAEVIGQALTRGLLRQMRWSMRWDAGTNRSTGWVQQ